MCSGTTPWADLNVEEIYQSVVKEKKQPSQYASVNMSNKQDMLKIRNNVMRVNIHCDGCKQKVKKILQKIEEINFELQELLGSVDSLEFFGGKAYIAELTKCSGDVSASLPLSLCYYSHHVVDVLLWLFSSLLLFLLKLFFRGPLSVVCWMNAKKIVGMILMVRFVVVEY